MNLTNTLKRIDVFLGASEQAAREADHIEQAVAALKGICDDLLTKALEQPESILKEQLKSLSKYEATPMSQTMYKAINSFLQTPSMKQRPQDTLTQACGQLVALYDDAFKLLCKDNDKTDRANYKRETYHALASALQRKYIELIRE